MQTVSDSILIVIACMFDNNVTCSLNPSVNSGWTQHLKVDNLFKMVIFIGNLAIHVYN